jgi:hypothetical protein
LFRTSWSEQLIQTGECLFANAVWGIWLSKRANGLIRQRQIYYYALDLWDPLVTELKPLKLYLCGTWARNAMFRTADDNKETSVSYARAKLNTEVVLHWHPFNKTAWENQRRLRE